jgi:hypothetical protein
MKTFTAGFREVGSLIAGALIGLSMVIIVLTMTAAEASHSQIFLAVGSSIVFAVGFVLQIVMTAAPRHPAPLIAAVPREPIRRGQVALEARPRHTMAPANGAAAKAPDQRIPEAITVAT